MSQEAVEDAISSVNVLLEAYAGTHRRLEDVNVWMSIRRSGTMLTVSLRITKANGALRTDGRRWTELRILKSHLKRCRVKCQAE